MMNDVSALMPQNLNEKMTLAAKLADSCLLPASYRKQPANVLVALQMGHELGLPPMTAINNIYVVDGRPTLSADLMLGLVVGKPDFAGKTEKVTDSEAVITIRRKLAKTEIVAEGRFSVEDAKLAGLLGKNNWKNYPKRMLRARAVGYACREAYPDIFAGVYAEGEIEAPPMDRAPDPEPRNVTDEQMPESEQATPAPATLRPITEADLVREIKDVNAKIAEIVSAAPFTPEDAAAHREWVRKNADPARKAEFLEALKARLADYEAQRDELLAQADDAAASQAAAPQQAQEKAQEAEDEAAIAKAAAAAGKTPEDLF